MSSLSKEQEIAYLFTLYAVSPALSTIAVRDPGGYFDPFRDEHYKDPDIIKLYSKEFLDVHEASMRGSIPDLYLKGQGEYFDVLRVNVQAADIGQKTRNRHWTIPHGIGTGSAGASGAKARLCSGDF